jgi:hypothetical protein
MPTLSLSRPRHGLECVLLLGMNIPSGGPDIAVASQVLEGEDIHVGRPTGQARVPKGVKVEGLDLRQPTSLCVLFLETRRLDVPASGRSRKQPRGAIAASIANLDDGINSRCHRDFADCVLCLPPGDL